MKLWLLRHARPLVDSGICYGALDVAADEAATQEAARRAAAELPAGLMVWYSPLQRCERLAHVLQGLRPDLAMKPEPWLQEMDFGRWEGVPWNQIPAAAMDAWMADFGGHRFGGRESANEVLCRVEQALAAYCAWAVDREEGVCGAWITHAGVFRSVHLLLAGVRTLQRAEQWPSTVLPYGALDQVEVHEGFRVG